MKIFKAFILLGATSLCAAALFGHPVSAASPTNLALTITADQTAVAPGESVNYEIVVRNIGLIPAERVSVVPFLPVQFVYANGAVPTFLSDLGSLNPGEKIQENILARIPLATAPGPYSFTAIARAVNADLVQASANTIVKAPRVLGASDTASPLNFDIFIYLGLAVAALGNLLAWIKLRPARKPIPIR